MYQSVCQLSEEPKFMFDLAEKLALMEAPEMDSFKPSSSNEIRYPDRHVQAGTFFGNIDFDDSELYDALRNSL